MSEIIENYFIRNNKKCNLNFFLARKDLKNRYQFAWILFVSVYPIKNCLTINKNNKYLTMPNFSRCCMIYAKRISFMISDHNGTEVCIWEKNVIFIFQYSSFSFGFRYFIRRCKLEKLQLNYFFFIVRGLLSWGKDLKSFKLREYSQIIYIDM